VPHGTRDEGGVGQLADANARVQAFLEQIDHAVEHQEREPVGERFPTPPPSAEDLAAGERVFESQCVRCHGVQGTGGVGPTLTHPRLRRAPDDAALVSVIQNGVPGTAMVGFWNLADPEARQVAAYVRTLGRRPPEVVPGDPARGEAVYRGKGGCARCHILDGQGAGWAPDLSEVGLRLSAIGLRQSLVDPGALQPVSPLPAVHGPYPAFLAVVATTRTGQVIKGTRVTEDDFVIVVRDEKGRLHSLDKSALRHLEKIGGKSPMPSYANILSDTELQDLIAYLASRRGEP
jgi:putative heme-binding domain-containing protein